MRALITAGGRATRLRPITWTLNKHLIPLANKPMLEHAILKVVEAGITDIGININEGDKEISDALGDGSRLGAQLTYIEQKGGPKGLAHIIKNARDVGFLNRGETFMMYLGDNIILGSLRHLVERFQNENRNCMLALSRVTDPERFGVPEIKDGRIVRVVEKPLEPMCDFAITGIYLYDGNALTAVDELKPSARGELEISDLNQWYLDRGLNVGYEEITGWWKDTGKPEDLLEGNQLLLNEFRFEESQNGADIGEGVVIQGRVKIGYGTKISEKVLIRGPVVIGENCEIKNSYIGPYTSIGDHTTILNTEIEHSIIFPHCRINAGTRIVDGIIGHNATITSAHDTLPLGHKLVIGDNSVVEL